MFMCMTIEVAVVCEILKYLNKLIKWLLVFSGITPSKSIALLKVQLANASLPVFWQTWHSHRWCLCAETCIVWL